MYLLASPASLHPSFWLPIGTFQKQTLEHRATDSLFNYCPQEFHTSPLSTVKALGSAKGSRFISHCSPSATTQEISSNPPVHGLCLKPLLRSSKGPFSAFRFPRIALFSVCPLTSCRLSSPPLPHPPSQTPTCDLPSLVFNQCAPRLNPESAPQALARAGSAAALPSFCCLADRGARLVQQLTLVLGGAAQASPLLLSSGGKIPTC